MQVQHAQRAPKIQKMSVRWGISGGAAIQRHPYPLVDNLNIG